MIVGFGILKIILLCEYKDINDVNCLIDVSFLR